MPSSGNTRASAAGGPLIPNELLMMDADPSVRGRAKCGNSLAAHSIAPGQSQRFQLVRRLNEAITGSR